MPGLKKERGVEGGRSPPAEMESRALLSSLRYRQQGTLVSLSLCEARSVSGVHTRTLGQVCTPCIGDWT